MKALRSRQRTPTLRFLLQSIFQSRSRTATDTVKVLQTFNMLGGGVIVQRFGDLMRGRRSTEKRIEEGLVKPTLAATPGDLSLVLPKRILDGL